MIITITPEIEEFVSERVRSGAYASGEEVILVSLRLLEAQEQKLAQLKRDIQAGVDDIQQGRYKTYTTEAELELLTAEIISRGEERLKQNGG
ncbi:MAG: type II toxin-antitoxin system ParD family antitoxin [Blastocatellia bacterium]